MEELPDTTAVIVRRSDLPVPLAHPARSFFGGLPKLPPEIDWPRVDFPLDLPEALTFVAQIDLDEVPDCDVKPYLPQTGTLYFFCSSNFVGEERPPCQVLYCSDRADTLPERAPPPDLMPLGGRDGDTQVKWLDADTNFHARVQFKYPLSFLPFQDFGFQDDAVGRELLTASLCEALGPGEPEQRDLLMHRGLDDFTADEDWPFNWLVITLATRAVLCHMPNDLEPSSWNSIRVSDEAQAALRNIEARANGWLERGARLPPLESVDADAKSTFRAWWIDVVQQYKKMSPYSFLFTRDLGNVINHVIRHTAAHDAAALAAIPRRYVASLERQNHWKTPDPENRRRRFFSTPIHQISGYGSSWQNAPVEHCDDVLLLQIQGDPAFFNWHTNGGCVLHFWINPDALSELDFTALEATLEGD